MRVGRRSVPGSLVAIAAVSALLFVALTVAVTNNPSLALDSRTFNIADDLRAPWLDTAAKVITNLGLIAIVGPCVLIGAVPLIGRGHRRRAAALVLGAALTWVSVWITKEVVDRPRPPQALVHTTGPSYPSAHAANSVGWLALAIALTVVIPTRRARAAVVIAGALVAILVGISRVYLRAHYASDVLGGEALAAAIYALTTTAAISWPAQRTSAVGGEGTASAPSGVD
jgi:membrane-associated phospholipid phosphatase